MEILYLHQYFCPPGGSGNNRSYELGSYMKACGHNVTFVTSTAYFPPHYYQHLKPGEVGQLDIEGMRVFVIHIPYSHMMPFRQRIRAFLAFYRKLMQVCKTMRLSQPFDLVYASSTPITVGEAGRKLARRWRCPLVYECVDVWPDVPIGMKILRNPLLIAWLHGKTNRIYRESARIVALSEGMRDQILRHLVPARKVEVIHNGTHPGKFPYRLRPVKEKVEVIYTGTVGVANGLSQLMEAASILQGKGREDIRFTILGEGNELEKVKTRARDLNLQNLHFLARVPKEEVSALLEAADIGVVCFANFKVLEANSANKFYDYLSSGLPVVNNYRGWQGAYLEKWNCGLACDQGDVAAFAANIEALADAPELRQEMGRNGRKLVEAHFDRRNLAARLLRTFEAVLDEKP